MSTVSCVIYEEFVFMNRITCVIYEEQSQIVWDTYSKLMIYKIYNISTFTNGIDTILA